MTPERCRCDRCGDFEVEIPEGTDVVSAYRLIDCEHRKRDCPASTRDSVRVVLRGKATTR